MNAHVRSTICAIALGIAAPSGATAQQLGLRDTILDRLVGAWILEGTIGGEAAVHDVVAEWVLDHQYLRVHEVARERREDGEPLYEAMVFIGWDPPSSRYRCLWLDSTGGTGLDTRAIGHAELEGDTLPFVFVDPSDGGLIHNTFVYSGNEDTWEWRIDLENAGERRQFARVRLRRTDP